MSFEPFRAVGKVLRVSEADSATFLGSCFIFRDLVSVVTAAHCVGDLSPDELAVELPNIMIVDQPHNGIRIAEVEKHPEADLAVLRMTSENWTSDPFRGVMDLDGIGGDLFAYGYPENVLSLDERDPTPRLFKGHVQRMHYERTLGFKYQGVELSFACPAGLSGGPVFEPSAPWRVLGVATANFESATVLEATEEITEGPNTKHTQLRKVISYGVAVRLDMCSDWLDAVVPPMDAKTFRQRQEAALEAARASPEDE